VGTEQESPQPPLDNAGDAVGHIEVRGIDIVPDEERHGRPSELFPLWFTSNFTFLYILFGGILILLGLTLWQAVLVTVVGNLFWVVIGITSTPGPKAGTSSLTLSRAMYGIRGNALSSFFNWIILVGFEAIDFSIALFALFALAEDWGWHITTPGKVVLLTIVIILTFALALYGHATIIFFQRLMAVALAIATVVLIIFILPDVHFGYHPATALHGSAALATFLLALSIIMSGPLSYPIGSDYTRYLPRDSSAKQIVLYTALGGFIPAVFLTFTGILAATVVDPNDFTTSIKAIVPGWFYPIFLLIVVFGITANNVIGVYSSGLSLQALGVKVRRTITVWLDVVFGTALTVWGVFIATDFLTQLSNFLLWAIYWYAPFFGIYMVDMFLRKNEYDAPELFRDGGRYWYDRGFRWKGLIALVVGMVVAAMFSASYYYQGPITTHFLNGADLSAISGMIVGGVLYWVLCRRETAPAIVQAKASTDPRLRTSTGSD
jgi:purine-cytosine permease-like protein